MEAWKDSRIEGWKDGSAGGMEGWDGPSRPPYVSTSYSRVHCIIPGMILRDFGMGSLLGGSLTLNGAIVT